MLYDSPAGRCIHEQLFVFVIAIKSQVVYTAVFLSVPHADWTAVCFLYPYLLCNVHRWNIQIYETFMPTS
jgi:hypothetical protein